eukprot:1158314-Pelagomonas_calceolata.AAC.21
MNGSQPPGWQYATVAGVQNGLLSVMYGPGQVEHLSPSNPGVAVRPPPQGPNSGWKGGVAWSEGWSGIGGWDLFCVKAWFWPASIPL